MFLNIFKASVGFSVLALLAMTGCERSAPVEKSASAIAAAIASPQRSDADRARDQYRHPQKTLEFFAIEPDMDVVEIWPGGGWYSAILAPLVDGQLIAAHFPAAPAAGTSERAVNYFKRSRESYAAAIAAPDSAWSNITLAQFDPSQQLLTVADESADAVLTFRNVHNWLNTDSEQTAFELFFQALKPGGVLGVVEHRAAPETSRDAMRSSGYMTQAYVVELAEQAGFVLEASSEVNANSLDNRDHPKGVWTLPPNLRLGDERREEFLAIGESDRMTLRFRKPVATEQSGY